MKTKLFFLLLITGITAFANPPSEEGKQIFTTRCAGCHNVNRILTGPALAGVDQRHSIDWIINFVHSSQTVIRGGDKQAVALFEKFNRIPMPDHPDLSSDNIKSIVEYIKQESKNTDTKAPFAKPDKIQTPYRPISIHDYWLFASYLLVVVLLISGLLFAVWVSEISRSNAK